MSAHNPTGYCPVCRGTWCTHRPASPGIRRAVEGLRNQVDPETERICMRLRGVSSDYAIDQAVDRLQELSTVLGELVMAASSLPREDQTAFDRYIAAVARARELLR